MKENMYTPLTAKTVVDYVRQSTVAGQIFNSDEALTVVDLSDGGNVNLIFRVHSSTTVSYTHLTLPTILLV